MKAILQFNLPEDTYEYTLATRAGDYSSALWEIKQYIRSKLKYGHGENTVEDILEDIQCLIPEDTE